MPKNCVHLPGQKISCEDCSDEQSPEEMDPFAKIMAKLCAMEKRNNQTENKLCQEMDLLRGDMASMAEAREVEKIMIVQMEKNVSKIALDIVETINTTKDLGDKLSSLDNQANKNMEEIRKLKEHMKIVQQDTPLKIPAQTLVNTIEKVPVKQAKVSW